MIRCGICHGDIEGKVYVLRHRPENLVCTMNNPFDEECIARWIQRSNSCPYCRCKEVSKDEYADVSAFERAAQPARNPSFLTRQLRWINRKASQVYEGCQRRYNAYKTQDMEALAIAPALMVLLQRVARLPVSYIPIRGLDVVVGGGVATLFGAFVAINALGSASLLPPWGWRPQENRVNGIAMMAGVVATALTIGVDQETAIGAGLLAITGLAVAALSIVKEDAYEEKRFLLRLMGMHV